MATAKVRTFRLRLANADLPASTYAMLDDLHSKYEGGQKQGLCTLHGWQAVDEAGKCVVCRNISLGSLAVGEGVMAYALKAAGVIG